MRVLLTGKSGFIGRNLYEYLMVHGYDVLAPSHNDLDLLSEGAVESYLREANADLVIHSANINNTRNTKTTSYESLDGNLRMFFNLAKNNNLYGRMFYFGSGAEYDMQHYIPQMPEDYFGLNIPKDPYGFSKYIMSKECEHIDNIYDFRLFGVFGRYEEWERRFISNAICRSLKGLDITIQKHMMFDYLWIDDLCQIIDFFIKHTPKHSHINICRGESIDLYDLACIVRKELGIENNIVVGEAGWKPEYSGCNDRLMEEIAAQYDTEDKTEIIFPTKIRFTGYEESIRELIKFYKNHLEEIDISMLLR